ncbi:MAG: hypothetical protein PHG64_05680 [Paludibacter sp.]|nr:hypothetical protein [Paludibacter sp.]
MTDLLLTAAQYNAEESGFGLQKLNDKVLSWVLLRLALDNDTFLFEICHNEQTSCRTKLVFEELGK